MAVYPDIKFIDAIKAKDVTSQVDNSLASIRLNELIKIAMTSAYPTKNSFLDLIMNKNASQTFDRSLESLEALYNAIGPGGLTQQQIRDSLKLAPSIGSYPYSSIDGKLDTIITSTGHVSTTIDSVLNKVITVPSNPMLNDADGHTFTAIPDMAKQTTLLSIYTSTGNALTAGFLAGAKEATLLEVQTSTGHISDVVDALTIAVSNIPVNPMLDNADGHTFSIIPNMAKQTTLLSVYTSTGSALTDGFLAGAKEVSVQRVITSTGHISATADSVLKGINDIKGTGFAKDIDSLVDLSHTDIEITKQMVADAMNLAATGTVLTGSVNDKLGKLITSTGNIKVAMDNGFLLGAKETTVNALHNISTSEVRTQVDNALIGYDSNQGVAKESSSQKIITSTGHASSNTDAILILLAQAVEGARTIGFTLKTATGEAIQDAHLQVWNSGLNAVVTYGIANSNGYLARTLDDGTYKVKIRKGGYNFNDPYTLVVTEDASVTYIGETLLPNPPLELAVCRLYGYIVNGAEEVMEGVLLQFNLAYAPTLDSSTGKAIYSETMKCITDETGYFQIDLIRNTEFIVFIQSMGIKQNIRVPDVPLMNIFDLITSTPVDTPTGGGGGWG